ncbi:hypothetical protein RB598_002052 [Gaeumannomyces tritici]
MSLADKGRSAEGGPNIWPAFPMKGCPVLQAILVRLVRPRSQRSQHSFAREPLLHLWLVGESIAMPVIQHFLPYAHGLLLARSSAAAMPVNGTVNDGDLTKLVGWVASSKDRGTVDIMWSSCLTILLCVWMATCPNVPSPSDKWYHRFVDKVNLALIGFLGPDFLFGIAIGQLASARKSVKMFREAPELSEGTPWTLTHGFFADMGGFHLRARDFPDGFPINAEQLFYLVKHGHLDFPVLTKEEIGRRSRVDDLSKVITVWQAFWFIVTEIQRTANGYPMTTLELTAISFAVVMIATSASWYFKPSICQPTILCTKDDKTIQAIRDSARLEVCACNFYEVPPKFVSTKQLLTACASIQTHPSLPQEYYRTPLDFISRRKFHIERYWRYYSELSYLLHIPFFNRQLKATPWDRFPSDMWIPVNGWLVPITVLVQLPFSVCFLVAWNFHFPTTAERELWRVCAIYHAGFYLIGTVYYMFGSMKGACERIVPFHIFTANTTAGECEDKSVGAGECLIGDRVPPTSVAVEEPSLARRGTGDPDSSGVAYAAKPMVHKKTGLQKFMARLRAWLVKWRNISPDQDPDMELPLRWVAPIFLACNIYTFCRVYIYIEDFAGLRSQPLGVYMTVNKFVPFL